MEVNVDKCELLVFHNDPAIRALLESVPIILCGKRLPVSRKARYLGLYYGPFVHQARRPRAAPFSDTSERLTAGVRATRALQAQLHAQGAVPPALATAWRNALARSVFSYGAEIWGVHYLTADFGKAVQNTMVAEQRKFMQGLVGVKAPPNQLLYRELGQLPLQHHWACLVLGQWNNMVKLREQGALVHTAFRSDLRMALTHHVGWSAKVLAFLDSIGHVHKCPGLDGMTIDAKIDHYATLTLPLEQLRDDIARRLMDMWLMPCVQQLDPRALDEDGPVGLLSVCRYVRYMGAEPYDGPRLTPAPHAHQVIKKHHRAALMRLRLCACDFAINRPDIRVTTRTGTRMVRRSRPDRVCPLCMQQGHRRIEDERHVIWCCPAYAAVRHAYAGIFEHARGPGDVMTHEDQHAVAAFAYDVLAERARALAMLPPTT